MMTLKEEHGQKGIHILIYKVHQIILKKSTSLDREDLGVSIEDFLKIQIPMLP